MLQNSMLPDVVRDQELLYRVVKRSRPDCITKAGRVSPALYKDLNGVSVDRDGGRGELEVIRFITHETFRNRTKAIASITAAQCYEIEAKVQAAPSEMNPFHANIYLSSDERKGNLQALRLADCSSIVFMDENVAWTR